MLVGVAALAFWTGGRLGAGPVVAAAPAAPAPAVAAPVDRGFSGSGHVVARRAATIAAQATGMIQSIAVEEGQHVARGALIARLDDRAMVAGLARAQAAVVAGGAELQGLAARHRERALTEARFSALAARGFARGADLDQARADLQAITADIRRAEAQRAGAAADVRSAAVSLDRFSIRAPFAGVVTRLSAQPGEMISPVSAGGGFTRTGICTIVDMSSLEVEVDVAEAQIARVAAGQRARITLQAYPDRHYAGRIIAVVPVADRARASFRVRVGIDDPDARILPEMAARVFFQTKG
ncbi:hypothetical protein ASE86_04125 [Sphingomonas sp. Leaf33]|nr:hypothetical protein ASE86_04125 [Sphingomonas sp. Leaf33]